MFKRNETCSIRGDLIWMNLMDQLRLIWFLFSYLASRGIAGISFPSRTLCQEIKATTDKFY